MTDNKKKNTTQKFPSVLCPECGMEMSSDLAIQLAYQNVVICEKCGKKINSISPHLKKIIQKMVPNPPSPVQPIDPILPGNKDKKAKSDLSKNRLKTWYSSFSLKVRQLPKIWFAAVSSWSKAKFSKKKPAENSSGQKSEKLANNYQILEHIEQKRSMSKQLAYLHQRSEVFTVLDNDVRDRLLRTTITHNEQDIIAKSFIYMTIEQQRKYLDEIESNEEGHAEEIEHLIEIINNLPIPKHQKAVLIDQLHYIPNEEHEDFIETLQNPNSTI